MSEPSVPVGATQACTREERVEFIVGLMADGKWFGRRTVNVLAGVWKMQPASIRHLSAEASRHVKAAAEDKEEIVERILLSIDRIVEEALNHSRTFFPKDGKGEPVTYDTPDFRSALSGLELTAKLHGLVTTKHEVKAADVADADIDAMLKRYGYVKEPPK